MNTSLYCFLVLGVMAIPWLSSAQSARIQSLEQKMASQKGTDFIRSNIQLSEWYLQEGYAEKAIEKATEAAKIARRKREKQLQAIALNREARALVQLQTAESLENATKSLQKSIQTLDATTQANLQKENLILLRQIARAEPLDQKKLATNDEAKPIEKIEHFFKNKSTTLENTKQDVAPLEPSNSEKFLVTAERQKWKALIAKKQEQLEEMNEEQIKTELLLMRHQNIVDSLLYANIIDSIQLARNQMELREQEVELRYNRSQRNFWIAVGLGGFILAIAAFLRYIGIKRYSTILEEKNELIAQEKARSEELLLNILPPSIAAELKEYGVAKAKYFSQATVLFTDFKNFTAIAENLSPQQLVEELNYCFKKFDKIVSNHGLEKIKTIGDAYMCVGGLPEKSTAHAPDAIQAAIDIQTFLEEWKVEKLKKGEAFFEARIGIHTGPLVAGVVGDKKFAYDVWGDTVNIASRMESSGEAGKINISTTTYQLIRNDFQCTYRGKISAKNKGEIDMYFVEKMV